MKLQGRNLTLRMNGEDVKLLHRELSQLGYTIPPQEVEKGLFEKGTREVVIKFQQRHNLKTTGIVDEITAKAINDTFIVQGTIRLKNQRPLPGAIVRAFDKDLRHEQMLGETSTDQEGFYKIPYSRDQFRRAEKRSADLIVRVYHPNSPQLCLGESELIFNAKRVQEVNLPIDLPPLSEYEKLLAILEPVREKVSVPELTEKDIAFLSGETGIPAQRIELLVAAARLGKQTELPPAAFYGFGRMGLPTTLSDLLDQDAKILRQALEKALERNIIPGALRRDSDRIIDRLVQLRDVDTGVQIKKQKDKLRLLGKLVNLVDAKVEAVVKKASSPALLNDKVFASLVEAGELEEPEAKELGLTVSLYNLFDEDHKLAEAVKKGNFSQIPRGKVRNVEDLVAFDHADCLALLKKIKPEPPQGLNQEGYAALLAKKVENLYPSKVILARVTSKATDGVAQGLKTLQPLFETNEKLFDVDRFSTLNVEDVDPETLDHMRETHTKLKSLANTYPGLRIAEILDNRQLSANDKKKQITARIGLLTRFHTQNPDKEFLFLDYSPDSADTQALDFSGFSEDEQRMVLKTVKAYQRIYSVTKDAAHTKLLLEKGHHSPFSIANMSRKQFVDKVGLDQPVGDAYYLNACSVATKMCVGAFGTIDSYKAPGPWAAVDNSDYQSLSDYLKKIDGWEALFGNLDYCKCEHCRSIFSPAAYLVDLMRFLEKNVYFTGRGEGEGVAWETSAGFRGREDHPLHLRMRRPDLWKLPLTCENTNKLIPYLDIINEVLENYIALEERIVTDQNDDRLAPGAENRWEIVNGVYGRLYDSVRSFNQPFLLPLERLAVYLAHFGVTREEITRLLDESRDVIAGAALMLSKREFELITERDTELAHLISLYGLGFESDPGVGELVFYDPALQSADFESIEEYDESRGTSKNDVQLLLKAMGVTRAELGQLITTEFVRTEYGVVTLGGAEVVEIHSEKRVPEGEDASVQNDIERIHGLSEIALDRMHRFRRLWRHVPWSIKELDLVLKKLADPRVVNGITAATLQALADILSVQRRFDLPVEELCALWSGLPAEPVIEGKQSLFDRLFNLPDFVRLNHTWPKKPDPDSFLHPAFRNAPPPTPEVDYPLHRLLAGLRVDDEKLHLLIINLIKPLRSLGPDAPEPVLKQFLLSKKNLSLLYRHARLAEALRIPIPHLFQLIRLAPAIPSDHIGGLRDLSALLEFYDWWKTTEYTLDDLAFITAGPVAKLEAYPDAEALTAKILRQDRTNQALTFTHTVFAFLEGVTEQQSQEIIEEHTGALVQVPDGYRVARAFGPAVPIRIPEGMAILAEEDDIREALASHVSDEAPFDDTLFTTIERVTEEQSRALFAANLGIFDKAPGARYRVAEDLVDMSEIVIPDMPSGAEPIPASQEDVWNLLRTYRTDSLPVFDDTLFTEIAGVTEEQSRAIVVANPQWIVPAPLENAYWLTPSYSSASVIIEPDTNIPATETAARGLLSTYHATDIIPNYLATELGLSVEKINALINLASIDLTDPIYTEALKGEASDQCILELVSNLLPLTVLFKHKAFDKSALDFVQEGLDRFGLADITAIGMENIRMVSVFLDFLKKLDDRELERQVLFDLLVAFVPHERKFYMRETFDKQNIQQWLAQALDSEVGLVITAHDEISLAEIALDALAKLERCLDLAKRLGVGGDVLKLIVSNDYEKLNKAANAVLSAFRAKYSSEDEWQEKIQPFEDKIRSRKRDALTDYLIHSLHPKPFSNLHDLYHHFLIDVELEGCARTSRVVAANSSLQLYMHRILMNLEQDRAGALKACIDEDAVEEWKWRKNYRVWEANRKIFLYPENYIEPDLRDNKTPLFEELESTLLQEEINEETVLEAYAKYMRGFDEVANLKIAGSYHDKGDDADFLHLFGVTASDPPTYYYRAVENAYHGERNDTCGIIWHPWRKIDVQIPVQKVAPIAFRGQLHVFWIEITTRPENSEFESGGSTFIGYRHTMKVKFTTMRLDGTWTAPQRISLYGHPQFIKGDGIIDDPLEEFGEHMAAVIHEGESAALAKRLLNIPRYDTEEHGEPKEGYTLRGYQWEQVYPERNADKSLIIVGHNFRIRSTIDFYRKVISKKTETPLSYQDYSWYKLLFSIIDFDGRRKLFRVHQAPWFHDYAHCSVILVADRITEVEKTHYEIPSGRLREGLPGVPIATFTSYAELSVINGSLNDCIIDSNGDLLLLQGSVFPFLEYKLKRLGTTLSREVTRKLFNSGVEGLLSTDTQKVLEEASLPIEIEKEHIEDDSNVGRLDFTGPYGIYYREIFFHIPFLIANHLNSQQKFAEAQKWYHYIFNPTAKATGKESEPEDRNWRYIEFREHEIESLREQLRDTDSIETYKKDPFNPHAIARLPLRFSAYQKSIVMKYIDNLLDRGDHLFARDTMESINEATLLYVLASDILGERPAELGECGEVDAKTYDEISEDLDEQDNEFLIEMHHLVNRRSSYSGTFSYAYAPDPALIHSATKNAHAHVKTRFYKMAGQQVAGTGTRTSERSASAHIASERMAISRVGDVLTKKEGIFQGTHWMGLNKQESNAKYVHGFMVPFAYQLGPVFCIPPNTELHGYWDRVEDRLFKIRNCMNISGVRRQLALFAPEISPMLLVRAKAAGLSLEDVLNSISGDLPPYRFSYLIERAKGYAAMLQGFGAALLSALEKKDIEDLNLMRTTQQQVILRQTRQVRQWEIDAASETCEALQKRKEAVEYRRGYYQGLIDEGLISQEETQQNARNTAKGFEEASEIMHLVGALGFFIPQLGSPFAITFGGIQIGSYGEAFGQLLRSSAAIANTISASAGLEAGFQRRKEGWQHQSDLADYELKELEKQIKTAEIRLEIANRSIEIHDKTSEQLDELYEFYRDKFSNLGLYTWLSTNLQSLFKVAYNNAYALAKLAERAYRFERGDDAAELIGPNHWDASRAGLLAGERLLIDLQNLERRFIETNYRSLEIDQSFSLTQIAPDALILLKETGECSFDIQEIFFDLFYPGHYKRKIRSARLTIPCITGPYTNVSATLELKDSWIRTEPKLDISLRQVPRSRTVAIATSTAQNDAGVFELNFRDERYMPFEGAGAVSSWQLSLPKNFRQFDYQTINDVIIHISYTAEQDNGFRADVEGQNGELEGRIHDFLTTGSLSRVFSFRQEFSSEFNRLLHSPAGDPVQIKITEKHFPIFLKGKSLRIDNAVLVLRTPKKPMPDGTLEDQSITDFEISINNEPQTDLDFDTTMGDLPASNLNASDVFPDGILGEHTLVVNNAGDLKPDSPALSDVSAIDSEKLTDIYLYLQYGIS